VVILVITNRDGDIIFVTKEVKDGTGMTPECSMWLACVVITTTMMDGHDVDITTTSTQEDVTTMMAAGKTGVMERDGDMMEVGGHVGGIIVLGEEVLLVVIVALHFGNCENER